MTKQELKTLITEQIEGSLVVLEMAGQLNDKDGNIDIDKVYASIQVSIDELLEELNESIL